MCCVSVTEFRSSTDRYSSLLGLRSFGQAWHWFKESRRANCVALHSFLTFIMLPWHRIVAGTSFLVAEIFIMVLFPPVTKS